MQRITIPLALAASLALAPAATAGPVQDANKATVRRVFLEIFNRGDYDVARQVYAPDFVNHGLEGDVGLAEDQAAVRGWRAAAPDLVMTVQKEIAEGDLVTVLWVGVGTNTGTGNGYAATGQRMRTRGITIWRLVGGRIREEWSEFRAPSPMPSGSRP